MEQFLEINRLWVLVLWFPSMVGTIAIGFVTEDKNKKGYKWRRLGHLVFAFIPVFNSIWLIMGIMDWLEKFKKRY